jgi:hypothetical protein
MNDISVFIYLLCFAAVFGMTCVYMAMMMKSTIADFDRRPVKSYSDAMRPYRPPAPHPEMEGVKSGEELLVYNIDIYYDALWKFYLKNTHTDTLNLESLN